MTNKEQFLFSALEIFKDMVKNGECSKQDINYFCDFSKRELDNRGASVGKKQWITKEDFVELKDLITSK